MNILRYFIFVFSIFFSVFSHSSSLKDTITLDFKDISVKQVLKILSEYSGIGIVVSDEVQGNITIRVKNVTIEQALNAILKSKKLAKKQDGNIIFVTTVSDMKINDSLNVDNSANFVRSYNDNLNPITTYSSSTVLDSKKESDVKTSDSKPVKRDIHNISIHYADVNHIAKIIDDSFPSVNVSFDDRLNLLFLKATDEDFQDVKKLITKLDKPVNQVMIEARIVKLNTTFSKDLGIRWGSKSAANSDKVQYNITSDLAVVGNTIFSSILNLDRFKLDIELSALQSNGYAEIVSVPKVMTLDKHKATIVTGQEVPYQTVSNTNNSAVANTSFKDALLKLDVTPKILPDDRIQVQLQVTNNSPAGYAKNGEIIITKNELNNNIIVKDGEVVILGGLYESSLNNNINSVPKLSESKIFGRLFKSNKQQNDKKELLIFLTISILNDD